MLETIVVATTKVTTVVGDGNLWCDETCVVNKCGINTFLNVIMHVIVKCKVMTLSCKL